MQTCIEEAQEIIFNGDILTRLMLVIMLARAVAEETENKTDNKVLSWIYSIFSTIGFKTKIKNTDNREDD